MMYAVKEGHVEVVKECFDQVDHTITTKVCCIVTCTYSVNNV